MQRCRSFAAALRPSIASATRPRRVILPRRTLSTPASSSNPGNDSKTLLLALTAVASGALGYAFSQYSSSSSTPVSATASPSAKPTYGSPKDFESAIAELRATFSEDPEQVTTNEDVLTTHGFSPYNHLPGVAPSVVVYPNSTEDVVKIVNISRKFRIPVVPYSGATSLEGHTSGTPGGSICIDLSNMDKIIAINEADSDLVCQSGVTWDGVNAHLKELNIPLFFPLDPGPGASLGGMMGTGCSGTNAVRYGTAKGEWFLNATVVLPSGEVIKTRQRARKSSAGFDTTKLFIGAEGTLGIVTEVTIRLAPLLPTTVAVAQFPNVQRATEAVRDILNTGVLIQCVELCDDEFMRATNIYGVSETKYPELDSLFFKFQGTDETIRETSRVVREIVERHGGTGFKLAETEKQAADLWQDRKNALFSSLALVPGAMGWSTDVCVPVSKLPQLVLETKEDIAAHGLRATVIGHVGDGNFHALMLYEDDEGRQRAEEAVHRMVHRAIRLEGTCTGEHGVGVGKKEYLVKELGPGTVELMKTVKAAVDPLGLFNPGKLYPEDEEIQAAKAALKK